MQKTESRLTIFFEHPFWIGVYERLSNGSLEVCKITFGSEPKDYEVYDYLLKRWHLLRFSFPVKSEKMQSSKTNPKRMQREIKKQLHMQGVGSKSQQALKQQHEENKDIRKTKSREQKEKEKQLQFDLRLQKKKKKRRGH